MLKNKKKTFDTSSLYVCEVGVFENTSKGWDLYTKFSYHTYKIMQELTEKEVRKYLKKTYGGWPSDLPRYQLWEYNTIRYFRVPEKPNIVLPLLTLSAAMNANNMPSIKGICKAVDLKYVINKNLIDELTLEEIAEKEQFILKCVEGKDNSTPNSGNNPSSSGKKTSMEEEFDKLFEK